MKNTITKTFIVVTMIAMAGCTMQKRQHTGGYHIDWNSSNKTKKSVDPSSEKTSDASVDDAIEVPVLQASNSQEIAPDKTFRFADVVESLIQFYSPAKDTCDRIIDKDGDEILVKVTEIGIDVIKYKNCDHLDGPTYTIPKSSVLMIEYTNGKREVIKSPKPEPRVEPSYSNVDNVYYSSKAVKPEKRLEGVGLAGFIISLSLGIIWWFIAWPLGFGGVLGIIFGSIGIHRCRKNRETKWGKGFAITSLILGLIMVITSLIVLFLLL
jgi:hypothetical protein